MDYLRIGFPTDNAREPTPKSVLRKENTGGFDFASPMLQRLLINFRLLGITQQHFKNY